MSRWSLSGKAMPSLPPHTMQPSGYGIRQKWIMIINSSLSPSPMKGYSMPSLTPGSISTSSVRSSFTSLRHKGKENSNKSLDKATLPLCSLEAFSWMAPCAVCQGYLGLFRASSANTQSRVTLHHTDIKICAWGQSWRETNICRM